MKKEPTLSQQKIIEYKGNLTVLARPGSGKTFTISEKIKVIVHDLHDYQGVVAISYTNKASKELFDRVSKSGTDVKRSFFGTISSFYLNEIIYKFAKYIFGKPNKEVLVYSKSDNITEVEMMNKLLEAKKSLELDSELLELIQKNFVKGIISLELIDPIALYIFSNCIECRNYIKARYTCVFIDEYQDCGYIQNIFFIKLMDLGLIGIAVGDKDQAIYQFAGKDSKYLIDLAKKHNVKAFILDKNFRCHHNIRDYALRLLDGVTIPHTEEQRIIRLNCKDDEKSIANAIDIFIPILKKQNIVTKNNQIAILVRGERTGDIISDNIKTKHVFFRKTPLDEDSSMQGLIFKELIIAILGNKNEKYDMCSTYIDFESERHRFNNIYSKLKELSIKGLSVETLDEIVEISYNFIQRDQKNDKSIQKLQAVLEKTEYLETYMPQDDELVQIMTLHKSKGLEFDVVFHLDLYKYIMPMEDFNKAEYIDLDETINLHYVGITRAKKFCFLVSSDIRTKSNGEKAQGHESMLFNYNDLNRYTIGASVIFKLWND